MPCKFAKWVLKSQREAEMRNVVSVSGRREQTAATPLSAFHVQCTMPKRTCKSHGRSAIPLSS